MIRLRPTGMGVVLVALILVLAPAAASDRKPPRIVTAAMLDADGDSRADRVRLTYSERVRHRVDRDGRYPFAVSGYRISSLGKAAGKTLLVLLVERAQPDPNAAPPIRYRRTSAQPVKDIAGNQALAQRFARTKAHGRAPAPPTPADADGDGTPDADDCAPRDASIHPKAPDMPDLGFVDSNCDGIDGTETDAIFASPNGNDADQGTKAKPKREIQAAVDTARAGNGRYVLVAFGTYGHVTLASSISIYGGYDASSWARRDRYPDGLPVISGSPEGVLAVGAKDVVLQHLQIRGRTAGSSSTYGIRAVDGASLTLQRVSVAAGDGDAGRPGTTGVRGSNGGAGGPGKAGTCDGLGLNFGGNGGSSPDGRTGGAGGLGGLQGTGSSGKDGKIGTPGGVGGSKGNPGKPGSKGASGENGASGSAGVGGTNSAQSTGANWSGRKGDGGGTGAPGDGGGGGGGGGGQVGAFVDNANGNGGGGGGGGGAGGIGGTGGNSGGGSFGVYLANSKVVVEGSSIAAGNGGAGGGGGDGGVGGAGGAGGKGAKVCTSEIGAGGDGGFGGAGGRGGGGGGGAGGPSIGIFKAGTSTATVKDGSTVKPGTPGAGGAGGRSGPGGTGGAGVAGIAKPVYP